VGGVSGGLGVAGVVGLPVSGFGLWASGFPGSGDLSLLRCNFHFRQTAMETGIPGGGRSVA
jgi:hypothetical protein